MGIPVIFVAMELLICKISRLRWDLHTMLHVITDYVAMWFQSLRGVFLSVMHMLLMKWLLNVMVAELGPNDCRVWQSELCRLLVGETVWWVAGLIVSHCFVEGDLFPISVNVSKMTWWNTAMTTWFLWIVLAGKNKLGHIQCHKEKVLAIKRLCWKCNYAVHTKCTLLLVRECSITKKIICSSWQLWWGLGVFYIVH